MASNSIKDQLREVLIEMDVATKKDIKSSMIEMDVATKADIKDTMVEMDVATKKDVPTQKDIKKVVEDVFHEQISQYHTDMVKPEISLLHKLVKQIAEKMDELKADVSHINSEIKNLKSDLSVTITRKEFERFKTQILRN
jgi:hypothetical protein